MAAHSPPRHRHDGTSPLPFGMDFSATPAQWTGNGTVWPHDPRTGWSYCVMIPSWTTFQDDKAAEGHLANPIVFYRVHIGIQSPHGVSTLHKILRRFSDFLNLSAAIKRAFPKKLLPGPPPKSSMMWMNAGQTHLQERKLALGDWLAKLLADIDVSRSAPVAAFFELEAAARTGINLVKEAQLSTNTNDPSMKSSVPSAGRSSSLTSGTEYGNDSNCETPESETLKKSSEQGLQVQMEGLAIGQQTDVSTEIINEGNDLNEHAFGSRIKENTSIDLDDSHSIKELGSIMDGDMVETSDSTAQKNQIMLSNTEEAKVWHGRRLSIDSIASEMSSARGSELSLAATGDGSAVEGLTWEHPDSSNYSPKSLPSFNTESLKGVQMLLPMDQRGNIRRALVNLHRRLSTTKADMEDLIARLNQEIAVKEFLATKVRDLEGEVDSTRRKSRDTLLRMVSMERENFNNLQWELEEARGSLISAGEQARVEQDARLQVEERLQAVEMENKKSNLEVIELREKLQNVQKDRDSTEAKARSEMRLLAKEIKALRKSQPELKEELHTTLKAKVELEAAIERETQQQEEQTAERANFLHEVANLRQRLQECSVEFLAKQDDKSIVKNAAVTDVIDLLMTSDNRIGLLAAEAQLLAEKKEEETIHHSFERKDLPNGLSSTSSSLRVQTSSNQDLGSERAFRKMLTEIFMDNVQLYKVVNSMTLNAVVMDSKQGKNGPEEAPMRRGNSALKRFL